VDEPEMPSHPGGPSSGASLSATAVVEHVGEEFARSHEGALGETQVMQQGRRTDDGATTSPGLALVSKRRRTTAPSRQPSAAADTSVR
jgi:hypothetical protein